jgi:hypothetical protein
MQAVVLFYVICGHYVAAHEHFTEKDRLQVFGRVKTNPTEHATVTIRNRSIVALIVFCMS